MISFKILFHFAIDIKIQLSLEFALIFFPFLTSIWNWSALQIVVVKN